jgi:hypothetical protein
LSGDVWSSEEKIYRGGGQECCWSDGKKQSSRDGIPIEFY